MTNNSQDGLSDDVIFDIASNYRRRFVLKYLHNEADPAALTDIATALAAAENDTAPDQVDKQARKRAYVSLYQTHVPRLAEEQIVAYDETTGEVSLLAPAKVVLSHIGEGRSDSLWPRLYFVLAVVGLGLYLLPLVGVVPERLWLAGLLVPLGVLFVSISHWRYVTT